jgi:hypothetical protein
MSKSVSVDKMGAFGSVPVVPFMPVSAQVARAYHGTLHLRFGADKSYVSGRCPIVAPSQIPAIKAALEETPTEPTWSGSGTVYWKLTVKPEPEKGRAALYCGKDGSVLLGFVLVDGSAEIISTDEGLSGMIDQPES